MFLKEEKYAMKKSPYKRALIWLSAGHFTTDIYSGFLNPIMPFIAAKIGISMAIATVIMSISQMFSSLLQPIFGFFADNYIKRVFIFWGVLLAAVFIPFSACTNNLYTLLLFIILGSLGVSIFHPQSIGFVIRFTRHDFTKSMGVFLSLGSIGYAFGPAISATITQYFGLEKLPYTSIVGILLAVIMFWCVPKISDRDKTPSTNKDIIKVFSDIFKSNQFKILLVISIMKALTSSSCSILLPFLWKENGHSALYIGTALFIFLFMGGIGSLMSPYFEKWLGTKNVIYISLLITLPLMLIFAFTYKTIPFVSLLAFALLAFSIMLATPITMVLSQRELPQYKSIIGGFLNGFSWGIVGVAIGGLGFLAQKIGIMNVLIALYTIPIFCAYFVRYLKVYDD